MSNEKEKLIQENKSLTAVLDLSNWKIGFAAWVFAGYSPLEKKERGVLIRLIDETEIPCGSTDYIEAEKAQRYAEIKLQARVELVENHAAFAVMGFSETGRVADNSCGRPTSVTMGSRL